MHIPLVNQTQQEEILSGGRLTGGVVRIGETVRRPANQASGFMALLLNHLQESGFTGAPRYLGRDEKGCDILTYISGWVPAKFQYFTDAQVGDAAKLLNAFHTATRESTLTGDKAVICHHDAGPNNVVFQHERPVAFIDFDMVAPGDVLEDIGYMAWTWCISSQPARGPASLQAKQIRLLADAYGLCAEERLQMVDAIRERQTRNIQFWSDRLHKKIVGPVTTEAQIAGRINWSRRELENTESERATFEEALR